MAARISRREALVSTQPMNKSAPPGGQTEKQVQLIADFAPRIIMCTPSYMLNIADEFKRQGMDPRLCRGYGRSRQEARSRRRCCLIGLSNTCISDLN